MIPLKKSGDPLRATEVNELVGSVESLQLLLRPNQGGAGPAGVVNEPAVSCRALNVEGDDIPNYCPVEITGHIDALETDRVVKITMPTLNARGRFGVVGPGILDGYVGRVNLSGVCLCAVKTASGDLYADVAAAGDDFLTGHPTQGAAEILYEDGGASSSKHLALIRFPAPVANPFQVADLCRFGYGNISSLSGSVTIDGVASSTSTILVTDQTTASQNGLYIASASTWQKRATPTVVAVKNGTLWKRTMFIQTSANVWVPIYGVLN